MITKHLTDAQIFGAMQRATVKAAKREADPKQREALQRQASDMAERLNAGQPPVGSSPEDAAKVAAMMRDILGIALEQAVHSRRASKRRTRQ